MLNLYCTKKLLERIKPEIGSPGVATMHLGDWYATALFWKPQLALLVNERTLLPVLVSLAPAASLAERFPPALKRVLQALGLPTEFIDAEIGAMTAGTYARTANRSVVGVMNQFVYLAEGYREPRGLIDPFELSLKLARTPCGPLYKSAVFPDKAVGELVKAGAIH